MATVGGIAVPPVRQAEASHHKSLTGLSQLLRGRLPAPLLLPVSGLAPLRGWATNGGNRGGGKGRRRGCTSLPLTGKPPTWLPSTGTASYRQKQACQTKLPLAGSPLADEQRAVFPSGKYMGPQPGPATPDRSSGAGSHEARPPPLGSSG
jgi:hypothetical protein